MRAGSLILASSFSALLLLGLQLMSPVGNALVLTAMVDIKPETFNLNMKGQWITGYVRLPENYNVTDIDQSTILLEGIFGAEWCNIDDGVLMVKFDASGVVDYLWDRLYHMGGKQGTIELEVAGELMDGTEFSGSDIITIMNPHKN